MGMAGKYIIDFFIFFNFVKTYPVDEAKLIDVF